MAEGIEKETQAATLLELGCEMGQGSLVGQPMPWQDLDARLGTSRRRSVDAAPTAPASPTT